MIEVTGDLWTYKADVRVITTNGSIRKDGLAVMGRGVAYQAKQRFPDVPEKLGDLLHYIGNHVLSLGVYGDPPFILLTFPVKHVWSDQASLPLIKQSAREIVYWANSMEASKLAMPRPGCGNGGRTWAEVKPIIADILDDRFVIVEVNP